MIEKCFFSISHYESQHSYGVFKHVIYLIFSIFRFIRYYVFGGVLYFQDIGSRNLILISKQYMADMRLSGMLPESDVLSYSKISSIEFTRRRQRFTLFDAWNLLRYCTKQKNGIEIFYESVKFLPFLRYTFNRDSYENVIANDPADPFVIYNLSVVEPSKITILCETFVDTFSLEWTNVPQSAVRVPFDFDQSDKFSKNFGFMPKFSPLKLKRAAVARHTCKAPILFFHQYYHSSGFRSFTKHIIINILVGIRPEIRFRLHPNVGVLERFIYRFLSLCKVFEISDVSLDEDIYSSRYALSIYSSAINVFKAVTGRPAKLIHRIDIISANLNINLCD